VDFDNDGKLDILSGCYWSQSFYDTDVDAGSDGNPQAGYTMMLRGNGDLDFETATPLRDAEGEPLTNVKLSQSQIENYDSDNIVWQNICTAQHLVDYDGDGDLDLLNGCIRQEFFLHVNEADSPTSTSVFKNAAVELPIKSPDQHSDPHLADIDGDGDLDLLTGGSSGGVYLSVNSGTRTMPKWDRFVRLVDAQQTFDPLGTTSANAKPNGASRVWVYDYNQDGKPDLLVGDSTTVVDPLPNTSEQAFAQAKAQYVAKYNELMDKTIDPETQADEDKLDEANEEFWNFQDTRRQKFDVRRTGHVWLYLQK